MPDRDAVAIGTGGMEIGALTVAAIGFREREVILDFFEAVTGLRMNHAYIRPGGVATRPARTRCRTCARS